MTPDPSWRGKRIERVASQIDLAPTILATAGVESTAPLLGDDLSRLPDDGGRAFLQHNREVGILTDHALVTLELEKKAECYHRTGRDSDTFVRDRDWTTDPEMRKLVDDATAVYQTAYELMRLGAYTMPADPRASSGGDRRVVRPGPTAGKRAVPIS